MSLCSGKRAPGGGLRSPGSRASAREGVADQDDGFRSGWISSVLKLPPGRCRRRRSRGRCAHASRVHNRVISSAFFVRQRRCRIVRAFALWLDGWRQSCGGGYGRSSCLANGYSLVQWGDLLPTGSRADALGGVQGPPPARRRPGRRELSRRWCSPGSAARCEMPPHLEARPAVTNRGAEGPSAALADVAGFGRGGGRAGSAASSQNRPMVRWPLRPSPAQREGSGTSWVVRFQEADQEAGRSNGAGCRRSAGRVVDRLGEALELRWCGLLFEEERFEGGFSLQRLRTYPGCSRRSEIRPIVRWARFRGFGAAELLGVVGFEKAG